MIRRRFGSYEIMMRAFRAVPDESKWKVSSSTATFLAGGMSSNVFWIGSFPFDAVKKCVPLWATIRVILPTRSPLTPVRSTSPFAVG
jgi:hypothetical protein